MSPDVKAFFDEPTNTVSYVVSDSNTNACAVIDSVLDFDQAAGRTATDSADAIIAHIRAHNLQLDWILETHVHADHLSAAPYIKDQLGGQIAIGCNVGIVQNVFGDLFNAEPGFKPGSILTRGVLVQACFNSRNRDRFCLAMQGKFSHHCILVVIGCGY